MNTSILGQFGTAANAASLRREQEAAKLAKLESYSKYDGRITRVYVRHGLPETSGIGGYAGGIIRTDYDALGNRIARRFTAKTFNADHTVAQASRPLTSRRAAMLWLANVNGLTRRECSNDSCGATFYAEDGNKMPCPECNRPFTRRDADHGCAECGDGESHQIEAFYNDDDELEEVVDPNAPVKVVVADKVPPRAAVVTLRRRDITVHIGEGVCLSCRNGLHSLHQAEYIGKTSEAIALRVADVDHNDYIVKKTCICDVCAK